MVKRLVILLITSASIIAVIVLGGDLSDGIRCGLSVCGEVVIPSLFPFMVLANFIEVSGAARIFGKPISYVTKPIFKLPRECAAPIFLSFISGYPVGAALANRLYKRGSVTRRDAERMLTFSVNSSPAMAIIAVGSGMLGDKVYGLLLYIVHITASVITGTVFTRLVLRKNKNSGNNSVSDLSEAEKTGLPDAFVSATADASAAMLGICGCVLIFAGAVAALDRLQWLAPLLEVTVGCSYATQWGLPLVSATLGFGGLSVIMQVLTISGGIIRPHILVASRITHAAISFLLCIPAMAFLPEKTVAVISTGLPEAVSAVSVAAPASAAMMLLSVVVLWSAKTVKK